MSKIIYCAFDDCDLADLAMGSLRRTGFSIQSIETIGAIHEDRWEERELPPLSAVPGLEGNILLPAFFPVTSAEPIPSTGEPATLKIVCADSDCRAIVSKLINFGAHRIKYY